MTSKITVLDVRADFRAGQHPCDKIQDALSSVMPGQTLRLLVPFEPLPLFQIAASKGLGHESNQTVEGDWEVLFSHDREIRPGTMSGGSGGGCGCGDLPGPENIDVDARGLEPPQPMVRILEALGQLGENGTLHARTDRRPVHLYSHLEERGFSGQSEEQEDGSFLTHIRRV